MALYAKHLGWLHSKRPKSDKPRIAQIAGEVGTPKCSAFYIVELVHEVGLSSSSWSEINAWVSAAGVRVNRWELNAIYRTIKTYQSAVLEYDNTDKPSPAAVDIDRDAVADQVRAAMRG